MSGRRVLIAGVGNIFLGDDGFGNEVVRRLAMRTLPETVEVVDFGISGMDLAYALMEDRAAILVDALPRGGRPGTLYVLEPDPESFAQTDDEPIETHGMHPLKVLQLVTALGGTVPSVRVVGCEPVACDPDGDWQMGLSAEVEASVDEAVSLIESLIAEIVEEREGGERDGARPASADRTRTRG